MRTCYTTLIILITTLLLTVCSGCSKSSNEKFDFLNRLGINIDDKLVLGDSIVMNDIYCGDPKQDDNEVEGKELTAEQYQTLIVPAGIDFTDVMSRWILLGVRDVGNANTLAAYYAGSSSGYCVHLMTYNRQGQLLDAISLRELHLLWRINPMDPENYNVLTLDSRVSIGNNSLVLHRLMGSCLMDYDKGLKGSPKWQQAWDQSYTINDKGHFVIQQQQVTMEKGQVDKYAAMDFKIWDLLACSLHDPSIMDFWNGYEPRVVEAYGPDYAYNPFPLDVLKLYNINPQRFLRWLSAPGNRDNRLLPNFKVPRDERPALLKEINRLEDPEARLWLTTIVNSWDDTPLTKHL